VGSIIMVMGVQRSGTNALFGGLSAGTGVHAFNERADGLWYDQFFLRSEPEIRPHLMASNCPVLLKPISETKRRSVADVMAEFKAHEPRLVWIYRDPVNCFYSHTERWDGFVGDPTGFAAHWCERNRLLLEALDEYGDQIAVVRYGDLIQDPRVFDDVLGFLGINGRYRFRSDRAAGRARVESSAQECIDAVCAETLKALDQARSCPGRVVAPFRRWAARLGLRSGGTKNQQTPL